MPTKNYFEEKGSHYAQYRPTYPQQLASELASLCPSQDHALDVGCGTGQFSAELAEHFALVTATDLNLEQIKHALPVANITYQKESAEHISVKENSVDLIVAAQAAHWFNLPTFYEEARRVAKDSALIALVSYGVPIIEGELNERFKQFYWQEIHQFWPPERIHVENGYQSLHFPFEELSLPDMSIDRQWTIKELIGYIETWSAVRLARKASQGYLIESFKRDVESVCPDQFKTHIISWPITARLGNL